MHVRIHKDDRLTVARQFIFQDHTAAITFRFHWRRRMG